MASNKQTTTAERLTYNFYFAGQNAVYYIIEAVWAIYFVHHLSMDPSKVVLVVLVVRLFDAINDPILGVLMQRVRIKKWGKYKFWMNLTAVLVPITTFAMFTIPQGGSMVIKTLYLVITYVAWDISYSISEIPAFSVATTMTTNEEERTLILSLTQIGSMLGTVFGVGIMLIWGGDEVSEISWGYVRLVVAIVAVACMIPQAFFVKERYHVEEEQTVSFLDMLKQIPRNGQHLLIMALYTSQAFLNAANTFGSFVADGVLMNRYFAEIAAIFTLFGICLLGGFATRIVKKLGKKRFLEYSMLATIGLSVPAFFIPKAFPIVLVAFLGLRIATLVVTSILRPMFTADSIEYGQYKLGIRNEAASYAIQTFFNKTGDAIGHALALWILASVGWIEGVDPQAQSPGTLDALWIWYLILPIIMAAIMYIGPKMGYKITEDKVAIWLKENEKRDANHQDAGTDEDNADVRDVAKKLVKT